MTYFALEDARAIEYGYCVVEVESNRYSLLEIFQGPVFRS